MPIDELIVLRGNPDLDIFQIIYCKDNLDFIKKNGITKTVIIEGVKICISHGSPYNVRDLVYYDSYSLFERLINDFNADVYLFY